MPRVVVTASELAKMLEGGKKKRKGCLGIGCCGCILPMLSAIPVLTLALLAYLTHLI